MSGELEPIEALLRAELGNPFMDRVPDLVFAVHRILLRFRTSEDSLTLLWQKLDSLLFNTVYQETQRTMIVLLDGGAKRITTDGIRDLADRLLALRYHRMTPDPVLADALFDLSRDGSFAAMKELLARYPMDEENRAMITRILQENEAI